MVQIIEGRQKQPSFLGSLMKGMAPEIKPAVEKFTDQMKLNRENEALQKQYGLDLQGIQDPQTRQQLIADQLAQGRKLKQAQALQNVSLGTQGQTQTGMTPRGKTSEGRKEVSKGEGRNFPQEATTGVPVPILTPDEVIQEGQRIAAERTNAGVPTTPEEGIQIADLNNDRNYIHNQRVEAETEKRINKQREYGEQAVAKLLKLKPDATDEQQAIFKQKAENLTQEGKSEADIDKALAREASNFKNAIHNVEKSVAPKRLFSGIKSKLLGTDREAEKERNSLRVSLKPLLDEGLYDTARMVLSNKGYYPEEQESVITDLGEGAKKALATFPKIEFAKKKERPDLTGFAASLEQKEPKYNEKQISAFHDNFNSILQSDPSVNLVLLRKAYEDKNIDWDLFKDALDTAVINGFEPNPDQYNHMNKLNTPPLNLLDQFLYNMGLIGR